MEYLEFERILSAKRMQRYKDGANGDTCKAMSQQASLIGHHPI